MYTTVCVKSLENHYAIVHRNPELPALPSGFKAQVPSQVDITLADKVQCKCGYVANSGNHLSELFF